VTLQTAVIMHERGDHAWVSGARHVIYPGPVTSPLTAVRFAKGHGTQNDFVLIPDPDGLLDLDAATVAGWCDRRAGLGGDGLIRVVRTQAAGEARPAPAPAELEASTPEWFMDYRNADGSLAEMCGNGLRVFVAYLQHLGLVALADGDQLTVATRAGVKRVRREGDVLAADLGPWHIPGGAGSAAVGADVEVSVPGLPPALPGLSVDVGNPHVVLALPDVDRLVGADLTLAPAVTPVPEHGTNVELVVPLHDATAATGHLRMRVHERGVGETRSCGTGAVAAVLAARVWAGEGAPHRWHVEVPGGRLRVTVPRGSLLDGDAVELAGPAVVVAEGTLDLGGLTGPSGESVAAEAVGSRR
jgi:diaminopimelate epimerase